MKLDTITCSDMRADNNIDDILNLGARYPMSEFAIQAHPSKFSSYMPRYEWFNVLTIMARNRPINLAMHVNSEYRTEICRGVVPYAIKRFWELKRNDNRPVIGRVQININGGKFEFNANKIADIIRAYPDIEFIFQYTPYQAERIAQLDKLNVPFSLLFDASGGRGQSPEKWESPVYENHKMGYSGGMSPENVAQNLDIINTLVAPGKHIWVDAEGRLKSAPKCGFDISRAEEYIKNAMQWNQQKVR